MHKTSHPRTPSQNPQPPPYVSFLRAADNPPYEPAKDIAALKALLSEKMEDAAAEPGARPLGLSLFRDALLHVCRIHRWASAGLQAAFAKKIFYSALQTTSPKSAAILQPPSFLFCMCLSN
jgi:hypothetical protein